MIDGTHILQHILSLLKLLLELRHVFVVVRTHDSELRNEDQHRNREVTEEELLRRESAVGALVSKSVKEKHGCRCIEGACHCCNDGSCILRECIGNLERRQEDESASQSEHDIGHDKPVEFWQLESISHQQRTDRQKCTTEDCAHAWSIAVQAISYGQRGNIAGRGRDSKEEVESGKIVSALPGTRRLCNLPQVLLKAHLDIVHQLLRRAKLTIDAHINQHRLQRREAKNDTRGQPTSQHSERNLRNTFERFDLIRRNGVQWMVSMVLLRSLLRRMERIVRDHPADRSDSAAMVVELTILTVNRSDAMDEGHMV